MEVNRAGLGRNRLERLRYSGYWGHGLDASRQAVGGLCMHISIPQLHSNMSSSSSLQTHTSRLLSTCTALHTHLPDLPSLQASFSESKLTLLSRLHHSESDLQASLASLYSHFSLEIQSLDSLRSHQLTEISSLQSDLTTLYVQIKASTERLDRLE